MYPLILSQLSSNFLLVWKISNLMHQTNTLNTNKDFGRRFFLPACWLLGCWPVGIFLKDTITIAKYTKFIWKFGQCRRKVGDIENITKNVFAWKSVKRTHIPQILITFKTSIFLILLYNSKFIQIKSTYSLVF